MGGWLRMEWVAGFTGIRSERSLSNQEIDAREVSAIQIPHEIVGAEYDGCANLLHDRPKMRGTIQNSAATDKKV
jgi:hypothetical protein